MFIFLLATAFVILVLFLVLLTQTLVTSAEFSFCEKVNFLLLLLFWFLLSLCCLLHLR